MANIKIFLFLIVCLLGYIEQTDAGNKRCTLPGAKTFRACKASCKVFGHDTGVCDDNDNCICSEMEYDFLADVGEWFEENLDPSTLIQLMNDKYTEYKETLKTAVSENLKPLIPSKCKLSADFCDKACKSIGRYNGTCNDDNTDCDCDENWVTPIQYGLCASETICRLDCQANGKATGKCVKNGGWDCECESNVNAHRDGLDTKEASGTDEREEGKVEYDIFEEV